MSATTKMTKMTKQQHDVDYDNYDDDHGKDDDNSNIDDDVDEMM